jgi:hypothetical protein
MASRVEHHVHRCAIAFVVAFHAFHLVSLPLIIPWDGQLYVGLADLFGTGHVLERWDFLRTPLFPLALKGAFVLFGRQPMAVLVLQAAMGAATVVLAGSAARRMGGPWAGAAAMLLLATYPTLVGYEHSLLSEIGTALFLSATVWLSGWRPERWAALKPVALVGVVSAGYFFRPSLLYLAPLVAAIDALGAVPPRSQVRSVDSLPARPWGRMAVRFALVALLPFAVALPWKRLDHTARLDSAMFCVGVLSQAVLPPGDPALGADGPKYARLIEEATASGGLSVTGLGTPGGSLCYGGRHLHLFERAVLNYPGRYLAGVARTAALFAGWPGLESDNELFTRLALTSAGSYVFPGPSPEIEGSIRRDFVQAVGTPPVSLPLRALVRPHRWLLRIAVFMALAALVVGLIRRDPVWLASSAVPLAFLSMHALLLAPIDRYAFPAYPVLLASMVPITTVIVRGAARRARRRPAGSAAQERGASPTGTPCVHDVEET